MNSCFSSKPALLQEKADIFALYLDLDGVIQHEAVMWHHRRGIFMSPKDAPGRTLFEWVHLLEDALAPFPQVKLVLSSTWCIRPGYGDTLKRFPDSLRKRFIGGTFHKRVHAADPWAMAAFKAKPRGMQIWADVQRRKPRQWLALDDDAEGWPEWARDNLVHCDGSTGLSSQAVRAELNNKLRKCVEALRLDAESEQPRLNIEANQHLSEPRGIAPEIEDIPKRRPSAL